MFFFVFPTDIATECGIIDESKVDGFKPSINKLSTKTVKSYSDTFYTTGIVSGKLLELQDSGDASSQRTTVAGGAWVHAPPQKSK